MTIADLRRQGYKVRVTTYRNCYSDFINSNKTFPLRSDLIKKDIDKISQKGGEVWIEITSPKGDHVTGISKCSEKEQFNKKVGREIAFGRALKELGVV